VTGEAGPGLSQDVAPLIQHHRERQEVEEVEHGPDLPHAHRGSAVFVTTGVCGTRSSLGQNSGYRQIREAASTSWTGVVSGAKHRQLLGTVTHA
jgi:hypothetical protein